MLRKDGKKTDWVNIPLAECIEGNCLDSFYTLRADEILDKELEKVELADLYKDLICPASPVFRDIEVEGILVDPKILDDLDVILSKDIEGVEKIIKEFPEVTEDVNFKSPQQLVQLLYSSVKEGDGEWNQDIAKYKGFGMYPPASTKAGAPSTDADTLDILHTQLGEEVIKRGLHEEKKG